MLFFMPRRSSSLTVSYAHPICALKEQSRHSLIKALLMAEAKELMKDKWTFQVLSTMMPLWFSVISLVPRTAPHREEGKRMNEEQMTKGMQRIIKYRVKYVDLTKDFKNTSLKRKVWVR